MTRFASRILGLLLPIVLIHSNCDAFPFGQKKSPSKEKSEQSKYEKLAKKARAGDVEAARSLAKWCYQHDADSERALEWLSIAAKNGDAASAKIAGALGSAR